MMIIKESEIENCAVFNCQSVGTASYAGMS
jgi:hypothetical protein